MRIIILGGGGFLGTRLAEALLEKSTLQISGQESLSFEHLVLVDQHFPEPPESDERLTLIEGNITDPSFLKQVCTPAPDVIFHLAAVVSGEAEKNYELGRAVNSKATEQLLDICREAGHCPTFVFASSCAVFGGDFGEVVKDLTHTTPQSSYGTQKAIAELLINDYSRRGWIDGRALRLPTIAVRPGKANAATTSFVSGIIREPLAGRRQNCPVDRTTKVWILSPDRVIEHFIHAAELPADRLGKHRNITLPGITTTIGEMVDALEAHAGQETTQLIDWEADEFLQKIVLTFPHTFETPRAEHLGFQPDQNFAAILSQYVNGSLSKV